MSLFDKFKNKKTKVEPVSDTNDLIKRLRKNHKMLALLGTVCDVEILPKFRVPEDLFGRMTYNISGTTFAEAGSGSEYILLEDGSIGFWGSEGSGGRIADNLHDFFEFVIYCPFWEDYLREEAYQDRERLGEFAKENFDSMKEILQENGVDLIEAQQKLANFLRIEKKADVVDILMRFYHCTKREPRFIQTYTEDDGSTYSCTGSLFDR